MDDQTLDMLSDEFQRIALSSAKKAAVAASAASKPGCEQVEEILGSTNDNGDDSSTREFTPEQDQTLPIIQKVINVSTKLQDLKKDHAVVYDEMKSLSAACIPDPEIMGMLEKIRKENDILKRRCLGESLERKRLYNEVIELKGNIRVFCRCRPLNTMELQNGIASVVEINPSQDNELQINCCDSSKKQFKFDHVFGPDDNQEVVFSQTKPVVCSVLDGYNVCIFAYGQTGTGKTFTMEGTAENRGVNYRTVEELFLLSKERSGMMNYEISVSMLEVYNEKLRDLLVENSAQNTKKLEVKQSADGTQEVPGLVEARVFSTEEVWECLKSGSRARSVGSTNANELSSRSHCLLRVTVKGENLINGQRTRSHLWMVDLAGSERVGRIEVEGERLKESQFINKSLSALGDVISALASKTAHIPYRNSKLTHLLQSSLGGDCKTLMFVQISPSATDLGETLCSLNFATRVRGVESGPARKQTDVSELFKYKQMVEKLKHDEKETKKLQDGIQSLQLRLAAREHSCRCLQEKVRDLEQQLAEERKMRLKQETRQRTGAASSLPTVKEASYKTVAEKSKPPLAPSGLRMPLRRITNIMPSSPSHRSSFGVNKGISSANEKENMLRRTASIGNSKTMFQPRRISIAARPTPTVGQTLQPRRRVSIATLRPEPSLHMATPLNASSRLKAGDMMRQSFVKNPRKARYSRLFSPVPNSALETTTPVAMRSSSSKFMGSPVAQVGSWKPKHPTVAMRIMGSPVVQVGSWKPRHPTVVALQRKSLVWSPLKSKNAKRMNK